MDKIIRALAGDGNIKMSVITAKDTVERARQIHSLSPVRKQFIEDLISPFFVDLRRFVIQSAQTVGVGPLFRHSIGKGIVNFTRKHFLPFSHMASSLLLFHYKIKRKLGQVILLQ